MKKIKIQAILTVDSKGNYNICGWSPFALDLIKSMSEKGLDFSQNPKKQFLIEKEIDLPNFDIETLDIDIKDL